MDSLNRSENGYVSQWFLFDQPKSSSRLTPELAKDMQGVFANRGPRDLEKELGIADKLGEQYLSRKGYKDAFQDYLQLAVSISNAHLPFEKKFPSNRANSTRVMNGIIANVAEQLGVEFAEQVPESYLKQIDEQQQMLADRGGGYDAWFSTKIFTLSNSINRWKKTYAMMAEMRNRVGIQVEGATKEEFAQAADTVWKTTLDNQQYGVKTCYFDSPLFLKGNQVFYVLDKNLGVTDPKTTAVFIPGIEAAVCVGDRPQGALEPKVTKIDGSREGNSIKQDRIYIGDSNVFGYFPFLDNGKVSSALNTFFPLQRAFGKKGMEKEYEYWRLFMTMRLHDLIVSADQVGNYPSLDAFEWDAIKKEKSGFMGLKGKQRQLDYKPLVLPRERVPEREPEPDINLTSEDSEPVQKQENVQAEITRFVDKHDVVWFTRKLPVGYKATNRAREYAAEHNVTLKEGETIVRAHIRGNRTPSVERPHKAMFRR